MVERTETWTVGGKTFHGTRTDMLRRKARLKREREARERESMQEHLRRLELLEWNGK